MDPELESRHLAQADRHIAEVKERIAQQRRIVQAANDKGHSVREAESFLTALEESLRAFERHRELILELMEEAKKQPQAN